LVKEKLLTAEEAQACPWCGQQPFIMHWYGGPRTRRISCDNDSCPVMPYAIGKSRKSALYAWNTRKAAAARE
jgi:hypothetical protein